MHQTDKKEPEDDPIDDCTKWIGNLPKEGSKEPKHPAERGSGRPIKSNL